MMSSVERRIDRSVPAERSIVARYRRVLWPDEAMERYRALLVESSRSEGLRILPVLRFRGVTIDLLDESSLMTTGTFKSLVGCVTAARCRDEGFTDVVFESGGNTGTAIAAYGRPAGLATTFVVPAANVAMLDPQLVAGSRVVAVEDRDRVKETARALGLRQGAVHVPRVAWSIEAAGFIGAFLLERALLHDDRYDLLAQSICAAFGPIGLYRSLSLGGRAFGPMPRFLGVRPGGDRSLSRVMYDRHPETYGTFDELERLLARTDGRTIETDATEFARWIEQPLEGVAMVERLAAVGIDVAVDTSGAIIEKTGLVALAGLLAEIEAGRVPAGTRALVCLTGGARVRVRAEVAS